MKRFTILNKATGQTFGPIEADEIVMHEAWGKPERWLTKDGVLAEGYTLEDAIETREVLVSEAIPEGETIDLETGEVQPTLTVEAVYLTEYKLAQEYEIKVTDISEELELVAASNEARAYLASTDYVAAKLIEAQVTGEPMQPLLDEYGEILELRKAARSRVVKT